MRDPLARARSFLEKILAWAPREGVQDADSGDPDWLGNQAGGREVWECDSQSLDCRPNLALRRNGEAQCGSCPLAPKERPESSQPRTERCDAIVIGCESCAPRRSRVSSVQTQEETLRLCVIDMVHGDKQRGTGEYVQTAAQQLFALGRIQHDHIATLR